MRATHNKSRKYLRIILALSLVFTSVLYLSPSSLAAGNIIKHSSGRYFQDATDTPRFLLGYYDWASVDPNAYIDNPAKYVTMIDDAQAYHLDYIRISLGINRFDSTTNPKAYNNTVNPTPFKYVNGKCDLNQWDTTFWDGLKYHVNYAGQKGIMVHISIFDGVSIRSGNYAYRWVGSFWNVNNQTQNFYGNLDTDGNGSVDQDGEFYRLDDFNNNTGVGYYQRKLIDKAISELSGYDNVFFEVGNELDGSSAAWKQAVISYIKSKTNKAVTFCGGGNPSNDEGIAVHSGDTPANVKSWIASNVGNGAPAWTDPDGSALEDGSADNLRKAAWYSLAGGAAGWGGFTVDYWNSTRNTTKLTYYRNLADFITNTGIPFWQMVPSQNLINNNSVNSCLAKAGSNYLAYVPGASSVTIDLSAASGTLYYRTYDTKTGTLSSPQTVSGGSTVTFNKPSGADDWAVYVYSNGTTPPSNQNLALNKTVVASSQEASSYAPVYAVDGDTSTRWGSEEGSDPQWIYVDLGASYNISRVLLNWERASAISYKIQVSNNASTWTDIYSTTSGDGGIDDITGLSGTGRYVRMYGTQRSTKYGYSLWEFEVYGSSTNPPAGNLISDLEVNDTDNAGYWSIKENLQAGDKQYGDRTYNFASVPSIVAGCTWIQTANGSKAYTGSPVATFKVNSNADVYVAHDTRITTKPSWLSGWTDTGYDIVNDESNPVTFRLYKKSFAAGSTVSLGPNGATNHGFYTVIVKAN